MLGSCLAALAAQRGVSPIEVIVVDNASSDATIDIARAHPVVTRVIREPIPGSYRARNAGLAVARGPTIAFTDVDCEPDPGWLEAGLRASAQADLVGGPIVSHRTPSPSVWERYDRATYLDQRTNIEHGRFAATANLFVRRAVFDAVGTFDGSLSSSGDVEFCQRATAAGYRLVFARDATVRHRPRTTMTETWHLHRRLGAGWAQLAHRGLREPIWRDGAHRVPVGWVVDRVAADGPPLRRRHLLPVHTVAMLARAVGRLAGR